ncbi:nitrile hydratase [Chryseobacterium contaminans]|uniref:HD domain-containing protein n=1 Tax=Chryseobacterium contaminans TaxID=1423959 RepID=A0A1M6Z6G3_9FLAO|nr:HD domain-containing protein [Chryseobacterium contaminans]OCA78791.1 nitrile hydratase [Chryseobacterium contaminans]SHL25899.1 HD domain-containing protein [Chryseobacterium contaminans]
MEIILPASGILSKSEIKKFKLMLIQSKLQENINTILLSVGLKKYANTDIKDIVIPDSSLAKKAVKEAQEHCNPALFYHSYRTYFWSCGFAISENLKVDTELLFVSSLLHDIGLTDNHNHICSKQCFANYGGEFSQQFCLKHSQDKKKASAVKQAIDMHLNPIINKSKYGNEAYSLSKGAAMDVIGANRFQLGKKYIDDVNRQYSRQGFKEDILNTMENFHHKEGTRANILYHMGFAKMANKNPMNKE